MIKTLTSLRFFFAFFVFLSHVSNLDSENKLYSWLSRNIFFEGYLGVSFFFILSGFVLSLSTSKKISDNKFDLDRKKFYLARIFRIYPLHILSLLIFVIFIHIGQIDVSKFLTNLFLVQSYIPNVDCFFSFNSPSWSISDEMFFYFMFPFLVSFFIAKKKIFLSIFAIVSTILVFSYYFIPEEQVKFVYYINPVSRLLDFSLGIILFFCYKKFENKNIGIKKATLYEIGVIILFFIFFIPHNIIPRAYRFSFYYWIPTIAIVFIFAFQKGYISRILQNKILVYLGEISFAFYMIHLIVIAIFGRLNLIIGDGLKISLIFLSAICCSALIFEYFEKPVNRYLKHKFIK